MLDKAKKIRSLIVEGDYSAADKALSVYFKQSTDRSWNFYPYNIIISDNIDSSNKNLMSQITAWTKQPNQSDTPHILLSNYYNDKVWDFRGNGFAYQVSKKNMQAYEDNIQLALQEVGKAIQINNKNPYSQFMLLNELNAFGNSKAMKIAFKNQ